MGPTLSAKEIKKQIKELRAKIAEYQKAIKHEFGNFKKAAKVYAGATEVYKKAKANYDRKPKAKLERKLYAAADALEATFRRYKAVYKTIESYFDSVEENYNEICDLLDMNGSRRKMEKTAVEFEQYKDWLESKLAALSAGIVELAEDDADETPAEEDTEDETTAVAAANAPAAPVVPQVAVSPVSVSPVVIDISSVVENAIENTMAKFSAKMDKKLAEYFDNLVLPQAEGATTVVKEIVKETVAAPAPVANAETTEATVALEGEILAKEQDIYAKLVAMSEEINAMLAALEATSTKQKDLNGMQKQTNDTLRRIMRDQQGIQVSLRVVNQDQAEVNAQQAAVVESQKLVVEQQQALADAQNGMIETQSAVIATQSGLNDAMKAVMQAQKDILNTQNKIAQGNAKAQEAGKALLEKQNELTELQKAAFASQRQAAKDYKDATGKSTKSKKAPVEEAPAVEAPAEDANA